MRRRIIELLASGQRSAGEVVAAVQGEFGLTQPAVSRHLRVLREHGFATVQPSGTRRLYTLEPDALADVEHWLSGLRNAWSRHLDALDTELRRGRREIP